MILKTHHLTITCCLIATALFADLSWKEVHGTRVPVPPQEHPRLYLRPEHIPALKARQKHPLLTPILKKISDMSKTRTDYKLELDAFEYLISKDRELGRRTIEQALDFLEKAELPDRHDACRVTGRNMVTGAIVYDWIYPLLTDDEKQAFMKELIRLAKTMECRYPPTRQGSITGHASEAQIMRDMLSAGIAIYDEYPDMYDHAAGRFFREHLPARNWIYNGHAYHQGDSYGPYRFSWDCFPLWIFDRLGAGNVYNPQQAQVPYFWIYKTRPDGQRLRAGDTFMHGTDFGDPWGIGAGAMLVASYYNDGRILSHYLDQGGNRPNELLFEFLWRDVDLKPEPINDLPFSRYFGTPFGWMIARTGWGTNSVIAEMKINEYNFNNHQHMDAGAFQIYYKGALTIDSGVYSGSDGQYGSPHCCNYYWRTVAHNTLRIYDPEEEFNSERNYGNDGGQRLPNNRIEPHILEVMLDPSKGYRTGKVLAQGSGPDPRQPSYTLLQGDITDAYSAKVKKVIRSFVFFNLQNETTPALFVVFARVVSSNPGFKKTWLLHTLEKPRVENNLVVVDNTIRGQQGRLYLNPLLPAPGNCSVKLVGGPGKEYWVNDKNYANEQTQRAMEKSSQELGKWRVELSPENAAPENYFLNAMQVTDQNNAEPYPVNLLDYDDIIGCCFSTDKSDWIVLFRKDITCSDDSVNLSLSSNKITHVLLTGLKAGQWKAQSATGAFQIITVEKGSGCGWLELEAGEWMVTCL